MSDAEKTTDISSETVEPHARNQQRQTIERRKLILINEQEIIQSLLQLSRSNGMTIVVMTARGYISSAILIPSDSSDLSPPRVIEGPCQILSFFGKIWPNPNRNAVILLSLSGVPGGEIRATQLICQGDVELEIGMKRVPENPRPEVAWPREEMILTIYNQEDIVQYLSSFAWTTRQTLHIDKGSGQISDGTVFCNLRKQLVPNVGHGDIIHMRGQFKPANPNGRNENGYLYTTLSNVEGGIARARRLIADGDVVVVCHTTR